jgi:type IV fimbrial biogenesis protein FimT
MKAFSLLECLIVLGLMAFFAVFAVSNFSHWKTAHIRKNTLLRLNMMIEEANQFAQLYGARIVICPKGETHRCGKDWQAGQLVFIDSLPNYRLDEGEVLLKIYPALFSGEFLYWEGFASKDFIPFSSDKDAQNSNGKFVYRSPNQVESWDEINLNRYGHIRNTLKEEKQHVYSKESRL